MQLGVGVAADPRCAATAHAHGSTDRCVRESREEYLKERLQVG